MGKREESVRPTGKGSNWISIERRDAGKSKSPKLEKTELKEFSYLNFFKKSFWNLSNVTGKNKNSKISSENQDSAKTSS